MADQEDLVLSLIAGFEFKDSRLHDALQFIANDLYQLNRQINPPTTRTFGVTGQVVEGPGDPTGFTGILYPNNLRLTWNLIPGAAGYRIKYGIDWATADELVATQSTAVDINPLTIPLIIGQHKFMIKTITSDGIESSGHSEWFLQISKMAAPSLGVTVVDNNVLLSWSVPIFQLNIARYDIYKNNSKIGTVTGTFEAIFETIAGTYEYGVEAVDIVGNIGYRALVSAIVNQPPDFELEDDHLSGLLGERENAYRDSRPRLTVIIDPSKTWEQHFVDNSWDSPQEQVDAGFPVYIQPTLLTGSYTEYIDYGLVLANNIVSVRWAENHIVGNISVGCQLSASIDNVNWTPPVNTTSQFYSSLRYLKVLITFTSTNPHWLMEFYNLHILLDVKREIDSGSKTALSTDTGGTQVYFNKVFRDVDSITLTAYSIEPVTMIFDFVDIPDPVSFFVYALSSAGNRMTTPFSWKARGIV